MAGNAKKMTIQEFLATDDEPDVAALANSFTGGAFMCCHTHVFAETGVWIDELVPVFQKLDAGLAVNNERKVRALSPDRVSG